MGSEVFLQSAVDSAVSSTPVDLREHTKTSISVRSVQDAKGGTHPSSAAHTASLSAASARLAAGGGCGGGDSEPSAAVAGGAPSVTPITPPWPTRIREFVSFCSSASYTVESHKTSAAANTDVRGFSNLLA